MGGAAGYETRRGIVIYQTLLSACAYALARALIFHEGSGHQTNHAAAQWLFHVAQLTPAHASWFCMRAWPNMRLRLFLGGCTSTLRLKQLSTDKLSCKWSLGPESARKRLAASSNSFAY